MNATACAWHAEKPVNMNKTALLLLLCTLLSSCKFYHIISRPRPELQWQDKTHCLTDGNNVWRWHPTPENETALREWWEAMDDLGTEDYWPRAYDDEVEFTLHPRMTVRFSELSTVFYFNRPGYDGPAIYSRRRTEADRLFRQLLEQIKHTQPHMSPEQGQLLLMHCSPPTPRGPETAWLP